MERKYSKEFFCPNEQQDEMMLSTDEPMIPLEEDDHQLTTMKIRDEVLEIEEHPTDVTKYIFYYG